LNVRYWHFSLPLPKLTRIQLIRASRELGRQASLTIRGRTSMTLLPCQQAPIVLMPPDKPSHFPVTPILSEFLPVWGLRPPAVGSVRTDHFDTLRLERLLKRIGVVPCPSSALLSTGWLYCRLLLVRLAQLRRTYSVIKGTAVYNSVPKLCQKRIWEPTKPPIHAYY
jgi:hypothetical protein